jgi:CBS domain containing-hemolysin-like protein
MTSKARGREPLSRDWIGKTSAGVICGFALAIAVSGLFASLTPGGLAVQDQEQVAMWLVPPIWIAAMSAGFAFRSGARAWSWLGAIAIAASVGLGVVRHFIL